MKILFLSRRFYPDIGGVEKHVFEVSKLLVADGHDVSVITQSPGKEKSINGISILRIPKINKNSSEKIHVWNWFWKNRELIREADVIHAHDVYWWYWPYRFLYLNKKSFITFHGFESFPIKRSAIIIRRISAFLANGNIAVGDFIKKRYGTNADFVTYGGIFIDSKKLNKFSSENKNAIFIGRLDDDTGILEYLEAEKIIKEKNIGFKFSVIGDGEHVEKVNKKNFKNQTSDYQKYILKSDYVFSSSYLMILEALSLKKLVYSVYTNDLKKDYLNMTPFKNYIVICDSSKQIAEKVSYYNKNKRQREKLQNEGYRWVSKNTWGDLSNKYKQLYGI